MCYGQPPREYPEVSNALKDKNVVYNYVTMRYECAGGGTVKEEVPKSRTEPGIIILCPKLGKKWYE